MMYFTILRVIDTKLFFIIAILDEAQKCNKKSLSLCLSLH